MTIQDAMAEAIYRRILLNSAGVHQDLLRAVQHTTRWYDNYKTSEDRRIYSGSWQIFLKALARHAEKLPEICTDLDKE